MRKTFQCTCVHVKSIFQSEFYNFSTLIFHSLSAAHICMCSVDVIVIDIEIVCSKKVIGVDCELIKKKLSVLQLSARIACRPYRSLSTQKVNS